MLMQLRLGAAVAFLVAIATWFMSSGPTIIASVPSAPDDAANQQPAPLDANSSPHAILLDALTSSGWESHESSTLAYRMLGKALHGDNGEPLVAPDSAAAPIDANTKPHVILYDALLASGHDSHESSQIAYQMLGTTLGGTGDPCIVYPYVLVYCDADHHSHSHRGYIHATCIDGVTPGTGLISCFSFQCLSPNVYKYLDLKLASNCAGLQAGTCVEFRTTGGPTELNCDDLGLDLDCSCFVEASPVNCSLIEHCCSTSAWYGCGSCPGCGD